MRLDDGNSTSRRTNKVTSSRQRPDGYREVSRTNRRNINRQILLLPQNSDFEWFVKWQPARVGTFFTSILRQLSFKDSLVVWIVMWCVNCHQKQVILLILLQDWRNQHMAWMMPRRWWNILDKALCSHDMVPTRADRWCYVLYSIQSRERTWKQNYPTRCHDAAFEKMLDPIARSPATRKSRVGFCFVDDLFGTGGTEMEQRVLARLRKYFRGGAEHWNDVTFTRQRICWM